MTVKIDKEFKELIPPPTKEELELLESDILKNGIRDKLVLWNKTIVDGHNRYEIAKRHDLNFETTDLNIEHRENVINWIINNQLGRRNITEAQKMYLRGKRYENEKRIEGAPKGNKRAKKQLSQNDQVVLKEKFDYPNNTTARKIAKEYGVAPSTIQRDAWFAKGVDVLPQDVREKVFTGEEKVHKKDVHVLAKMEPKLQKQTVRKIKEGISIVDAVRTSDPKTMQKEKRREAESRYMRDKVSRNKLKFENLMYGDVTVTTLEEILEKKDKIKPGYEIWIFKNIETAHKSKIELRKNLTLKFN